MDAKPVFDVPTVREYFMDLDYVLSFISDGPAKSFAFRRLKYLLSKWSMYSLVNEYQELADMKVSRRISGKSMGLLTILKGRSA